MTKKEIILEILNNQNNMISTHEITDIFYSEYKYIIENKKRYYNDNNIKKTDNEIFVQINAEISSTIIRYLSNKLVMKKINNKNHYILKEKHQEKYQENDEYNVVKIRKKKKETIKVERDIIYQMTCEDLDWKCLTIYKHNEHLNYEITNITEYTYIFSDSYKKTIKIGKTSQESPEKRLKNFLTGNIDIDITIVFPATLYKEKFLHDKYDIYRVQDNREWFFKSKDLIKFIEEHKEKNKIALDWYYKFKKTNDIEKKILKFKNTQSTILVKVREHQK